MHVYEGACGPGHFFTEQTSNMKGELFFPRISVDRFGVTGTLAGYLSGDVDVYGILLVRPRFIYSPPQKHNDRNHIIIFVRKKNVKLSEQYRLIREMYHYFFSRSKNVTCF